MRVIYAVLLVIQAQASSSFLTAGDNGDKKNDIIDDAQFFF